jgi:hypothetical protein
MCTHKEQYLHASAQNTDNYFSHFFTKDTDYWSCDGDILSEIKNWENKTHETVKWLKGERLKYLEDVIHAGQVNVKKKGGGGNSN